MKKIDDALSIAKELHSHSIVNSNKYYADKLLQIIINLSTINEQLLTNVKSVNYEDEIQKVRRKVPKWMKKTHQYNYRILEAYMDLSEHNMVAIHVEELESYMEIKPKIFLGHYNSMKTISEKNHAKVFEEIDKHVELWDPVAKFIEDIFEDSQTSKINHGYTFNGKTYKKNNRSGESFGNLIYDIFKKYLDENPNKTYKEIQSIFNKLHKDFSSESSSKKVIFNKHDFNQWFDSDKNKDTKKNKRYFGYGKYGNPIKYNDEDIYFTTQWGNKSGEYGNINTFIDFSIKELGYEIKKI